MQNQLILNIDLVHSVTFLFPPVNKIAEFNQLLLVPSSSLFPLHSEPLNSMIFSFFIRGAFFATGANFFSAAAVRLRLFITIGSAALEPVRTVFLIITDFMPFFIASFVLLTTDLVPFFIASLVETDVLDLMTDEFFFERSTVPDFLGTLSVVGGSLTDVSLEATF